MRRNASKLEDLHLILSDVYCDVATTKLTYTTHDGVYKLIWIVEEGGRREGGGRRARKWANKLYIEVIW